MIQQLAFFDFLVDEEEKYFHSYLTLYPGAIFEDASSNLIKEMENSNN